MDNKQKYIDSLVYEYLGRMEKNASVLFSVNRMPVSKSYEKYSFGASNVFLCIWI